MDHNLWFVPFVVWLAPVEPKHADHKATPSSAILPLPAQVLGPLRPESQQHQQSPSAPDEPGGRLGQQAHPA